MIGLNRERDKNCFCFFIKVNYVRMFSLQDYYLWICSQSLYRQFIIQYRVQYCVNPCTDMLLNHFYVDNLVNTHCYMLIYSIITTQ